MINENDINIETEAMEADGFTNAVHHVVYLQMLHNRGMRIPDALMIDPATGEQFYPNQIYANLRNYVFMTDPTFAYCGHFELIDLFDDLFRNYPVVQNQLSWDFIGRATDDNMLRQLLRQVRAGLFPETGTMGSGGVKRARGF